MSSLPVSQTFTLRQWQVALACNVAGQLGITLISTDGTAVDAVDVIAGDPNDGDSEYGERFTTEGIEAAYQKDDSIEYPQLKESVTIQAFKVVLIADSDNHLNVYVTHADKVSLFTVDDKQNDAQSQFIRTFKEI